MNNLMFTSHELMRSRVDECCCYLVANVDVGPYILPYTFDCSSLSMWWFCILLAARGACPACSTAICDFGNAREGSTRKSVQFRCEQLIMRGFGFLVSAATGSTCLTSSKIWIDPPRLLLLRVCWLRNLFRALKEKAPTVLQLLMTIQQAL